MSGEDLQIFSIIGFFTALLFVIGLYCLVVTRNLIRAIIGLEILIKAATLLIIAVGYATGRTALTQSLVITVIVIEVVVVAMAGGLTLRIYKHNDSLDARMLKRMRG